MYNPYFYILLLIVVLHFFGEQLLAYLNRKSMSAVIPFEVKGIYSPEEYSKQQIYQGTTSRFSLLSSSLSFTLLLLVLFWGVLGKLDNYLQATTSEPTVQSLLFFGVLFLASALFNLPFSWYSTFVIEERFGFNRTTAKTFCLDSIKSLFLNLLIGGLLLFLIIWVYRQTGTWFWFLAWGIVTAFSLLTSVFYSEWIVPLFNKQTPLPEGDLRSLIENFAQKSDFHLQNIYVIDGSRRSSKANAYFTGFGKKKRVVLYDTLLNDLDQEEVLAVLAHELGHYKKHHIWQSLLSSFLFTGILFYILSLFLASTGLAQALGGKESSFHLGLVGFSFLFTPLSELAGLGFNLLSRKNEYEADAYAASFGLAKSLESGLIKLSRKSLSNLQPHPWYVFWYYSHPPLLQRIQALEAYSTQPEKLVEPVKQST